jgi:hypothetical protein
MTVELAEKGFMVQAASGRGLRFYYVGKETEPEALAAVQHVVGNDSKIEIARRLSEVDISWLKLKPHEVRQFAA